MRIDYAIIKNVRALGVLLGSSLPSMGGGDFYEVFEKIIFIGKIFEINYRYLSFL